MTMTTTRTDKLSSQDFKRTLANILVGRDSIEFIPNPGNAGDALINAGAWQVLEEIGVADRVRRPRAGVAYKVSMYPGGGNLIPRYSDARLALQSRLDQNFDTLVILPHTIRGNEDLLARMDQRVHVFCRDLETLGHVTAHAPRANIYLADDLAFQLDIGWLASPKRRALRMTTVAMRPSSARRYLNWRLRIRHMAPTAGCLRIMRVDVEAAGTEEADPVMDLSAHYGSFFDVRGEPELVAGDFIHVLDQAREVVTDRLHVAIGASLLGKEVTVLDNNYGKNRALYELSMKDRFPRTRFGTA